MDFGEAVLRTIAIGIGATAVMDLWASVQKRLLGIPLLNYALVGRWLAGLARGKVFHDAIGRSPPAPGEKAIGWVAHYAIGIMFAGLIVAVAGRAWLSAPTPDVAVLIGLATVAAPFLVLQPGMGAGIAASRTPKPAVARTRSIIAHLSFGIGLYLAGVATTIIAPLQYQMRV